MRTTIYIDIVTLEKLKSASFELNISKAKLISILLARLINDNNFKSKPYKAVQYQDSCPDIDRKREHIDFEPVFYEKSLDLRRNFKYSVSWLISYAIINCLDAIMIELTTPRNHEILDNYDRNFVYIAKMFGEIPGFITLLGFPEKKYLYQLL